jgi:hypothetical protein
MQNIFLVIVTFLIINIIFVNSYNSNRNHLSVSQLRVINSLITHPTISPNMRNKINSVLFNYFEKWAIHQAFVFKKYHCFKCRSIKGEELGIYAIKGLVDGIRNYNGKSKFIDYIKIYINSQLLKGMTDLQPLTFIPKHVRRSKNWMSKITKHQKNKKYLKKTLNPSFIGTNNWMVEKNQKEETTQLEKIIDDEYIANVWLKINDIDEYSKNIFYLKYNYQFEKIRSNKNISLIMNCSEEKVRKNLKQTKNYINETFLSNMN